MANNINIETGSPDGIKGLRTTDNGGDVHSQHVRIEGAEFAGAGGPFQAKITSDGEVAVTNTVQEIARSLRYLANAVSATQYVLLVDLSDTVNFPHAQTGRIDISQLHICIDKAGNSAGSVKIGVITRIDGTDADIEYLTGLSFTNSADNWLESFRNWDPAQLKAGVDAGTITNGITSDKESAVTAVNTGTALPCIPGSTEPSIGDIVLKLDHVSGGNYNAEIELMYHSHV